MCLSFVHGGGREAWRAKEGKGGQEVTRESGRAEKGKGFTNTFVLTRHIGAEVTEIDGHQPVHILKHNDTRTLNSRGLEPALDQQ